MPFPLRTFTTSTSVALSFSCICRLRMSIWFMRISSFGGGCCSAGSLLMASVTSAHMDCCMVIAHTSFHFTSFEWNEADKGLFHNTLRIRAMNMSLELFMSFSILSVLCFANRQWCLWSQRVPWIHLCHSEPSANLPLIVPRIPCRLPLSTGRQQWH